MAEFICTGQIKPQQDNTSLHMTYNKCNMFSDPWGETPQCNTGQELRLTFLTHLMWLERVIVGETEQLNATHIQKVTLLVNLFYCVTLIVSVL